MKILFFSLIVLLSLSGQAQNQTAIDSLQNQINEIRSGMLQVKENLQLAHEQYREGIVLSIVGTCVSGGALFLPDNKGYGSIRNSCLVLGGIAAIVGAIQIIDSHKYIGRAGNWTFTGTGIVFRIE